MKLDFKSEKTKILGASTLSVLGIILIVIGFNIPKKDNRISSNNTSYQNNNQKLDDNKELEDNYDNNDDTENLVEDKEVVDNSTEEENKQEDTNEEQDKSDTNNKEETSEKESSINETETTNLQNTLTVYKNDDNYCKDKSDICNTIAFTIIVDSQDAKILEFSENNNYMLYKDNELKIYNTKTKETTKINLTNTDEETYKIITNKDRVVGLIYKNKDTEFMGYYNINESIKMYENKYTTISKTDYENYLVGTIEEDGKVNYSLLKTQEEKIELEDKTSNSCELKFEIFKNNDSKIFIEYDTCLDGGIKNIYANSKKIIASNLLNSDYYSIYDNNIYINDDNTIKKYDFEGNLLDDKKITEFKQLIRNNVIYVDNASLFLYDMNTKENIKFGEWNSNNIYLGSDSDTSSGYKTSKNLETINKIIDSKATDEGIYLIINYKDKDKDGNLGIVYFYNRNIGVRIYNIKKNN